MDNLAISDFLRDLDNRTHRGTCKACSKLVQWSREPLASHKRKNCPDSTDAEREMFAKRPKNQYSSDCGGSSNSMAAINFQRRESKRTRTRSPEVMTMATNCVDCDMTDDHKEEIDSKLADFFFQSGISFRMIDSEAFQELVKSLNHKYAATMPNATELSGRLLDQKCNYRSTKLVEISDSWTNRRGDHIMNICIKSPDQNDDVSRKSKRNQDQRWSL